MAVNLDKETEDTIDETTIQPLSKSNRILSLESLGTFSEQLTSTPGKKSVRTPSGSASFSPINLTRKAFSPSKDKTFGVIDKKKKQELLQKSKSVGKSCEHGNGNQRRLSDYAITVKQSTMCDADKSLFGDTPEQTQLHDQTTTVNHDESNQQTASCETVGASFDMELKERKRKIISNSNSPIAMHTDQTGVDAALQIDESGGVISDLPQKRYKTDQEEVTTKFIQLLEQIMERTQGKENLQVIDLRTVHGMLQSVSSEIEGIKHAPTPDLELFKTSLKKEVEEDVNKIVNIQEEEIAKLRSELDQVKKRAQLSEEVIKYNALVMNDVTKRLDNVELNNVKRMAILSGVTTSTKKHECKQEVIELFQKYLYEQADIDDVYHMGSKEPRPIVITFSSVSAKEKIFAVKTRLKTAKDDTQADIYLNHYITSAENDKRKRERQIISENKKKEGEEKLEIEKVKGGIKIGETFYKKAVETPKPTDLLGFSSADLDRILKFPTLKGPEVKKGDNIIIAYSIDTDRIQHVRDAYYKVRLMHASARHVVCAYNLPASTTLPDVHLLKDYCDDEDIGVGNFMLGKMKANNITHKAVFLVRYCGKMKLGEDRFPCYLQAFQALLSQKPINAITRKQQSLKEESGYNNSSAVGNASPRRGRGRGRGRGGGASPRGGAHWSSQTTMKKTYAEATSPK